jgi:eukaryotic-like serine/threonine-protein kinase
MNSERIILDRYRLDERVAAGGMAEVWRARDTQLDRDVAVKLLHPHLLPDAVSRARLAAEARAAAALNHPAIVEVYDVDADGESPALVMEYVSGSSLAARLAADGPLPAEEVARIGAEIAEALYLAHRRGVVHRDVKPGNILIDREGRPRLVDFGIAHSLALGAERLTTTGTVIGTLHSMAPEQLLGEAITPRTDLYGLGTVLHEALTGRPPYAETSPVALVRAQQAGPPTLAGVPAGLATIVAACLQADPAQRPIHAGAVAAALRGWLAGDESPPLGIAPRAGDVDTAAQTQVQAPIAAAPVVAAAAEAPPSDRPSSGRRVAALPMCMVALVLAALLLVAILSSGLLRRGAAPGDASSPAPTATPVATPSATPTPAFDVNALPPPIAEHIRKWWEDCGTEGQPPPVDISGMDKKQVEEALKPFRDECKGEEG